MFVWLSTFFREHAKKEIKGKLPLLPVYWFTKKVVYRGEEVAFNRWKPPTLLLNVITVSEHSKVNEDQSFMLKLYVL